MIAINSVNIINNISKNEKLYIILYLPFEYYSYFYLSFILSNSFLIYFLM